MKRRMFLHATAAGAAGAAIAPRAMAAASAPADRQPNILLILTDDQGWGDLSCHGNPHLRTPNIDRLAAEGIELTHFYVSPVCTPTRASLMTGRWNYRTRAIDTYLGRAMMDPEEVTVAEMLSAAGYRTGIFGKWHLGDNYPMRAMDQGFQESLVHNGGGIAQPSDPPGNPGYFDPILIHNGKEEKQTGYCMDVYTQAAIRFIEADRTRPFFCYLATNTPHVPLQVADSYAAPYKAAGLDDDAAKVYGMIANIDENVGRLVARLAELGIHRDTILIFMTDNGPQQRNRFSAGLRAGKGTVYDGGIRVPFFIRWPARLKAGMKIDRIAAHVDLVPTLLSACGLEPPPNLKLDGASLMPLLEGRAADWPNRNLFFQWHRGDVPVAWRDCCVREDRFKLVSTGGKRQLFDMIADPGETRDVSAEHPDVLARLSEAYEAWFKDVSATRGYDPPRIHLGTRHENPTRLSRQDWRGPRAGWAKDSLGYWEVHVAEAARFEITLRFPPVMADRTAHFRLGGVEVSRPLVKGADQFTFEPIALEAGPGRLEAWLAEGDGTTGVHYVEVKRLG